MTVAVTIRKLTKLVNSDPRAKSRLAAIIGIASTSTIDKWVSSGKISKLKQSAVAEAIKEMEKK